MQWVRYTDRKKRKIKLKMRVGEEIRRQVLKIKRETIPRYYKG